mmetsp:Transcript_30445/g.27685  ORF Transcript_30445/g.27685 Transcript_30445/m.27685 type:complete len:178 (+) Transcript_30445:371-904(+)
METLTVDKDSKFLRYSEFLSAAMDKRLYTNEERLWDAFRRFDVDNSGFITATDIKKAMARAGRKIPDSEVEKMMKEFDPSSKGQISFENFKEMMTADDNEYEVNYLEDKAIRSERASTLVPADISTPLSIFSAINGSRRSSGLNSGLYEGSDKKSTGSPSPKPRKSFGEYLSVDKQR